MNWIEDNNFPTQEYEFNTLPYTYPEGAKCQHDADIYKDELFYKLLVCPYCDVIVALYQEKWGNTQQTYDRFYMYIPHNHPCRTFLHVLHPILKPGECDYCIPYPRAMWHKIVSNVLY